jgi:tryptophan synthase alpha chain
MSRIAARFAALKREGRGALIPFLEAYDPDLETSTAILHGMPAAACPSPTRWRTGRPFSSPDSAG